MKSPKAVCKKYGLNSYPAQKGAEVMMNEITEDLLTIINTFSVRPLHERVAEYLKFK